MIQSDVSSGWCAVYVKSRCEFKVSGLLAKKNIECFLPTIERLQRWKNVKKLKEFPIFNGYVFANIANRYAEILSILRTQGVVRILGSTQCQPSYISQNEILSLKKIVECKQSTDVYPYLKEGQKVRIKKGPLLGAEGFLVKKLSNYKLVVSIDILQRALSITIDPLDVDYNIN
ncbi:UpxY family transcription antiterminator [Candidatus Magnetominusculus xianensis]|uniref:Transcription antitermination protein NusG n=1 Tax=Candidatus Magnetominusculus xianensis TaxID=1748249 RepID=A0ABR5SHJ3_9BACT|nr:UpxY family transcription antiterminator [Candidatus Magnetominusculus xianensis]KWT91568.1 transcription antitermination protein NusG [Candidatus Magnetominusculus xianensis]MBF0404354.1 UpxY family transcription antiterminator [Nitrospirota bacterium]